MLPQQRQRAIRDLISTEGSARTNDLAERFEVTVETIRRDLEAMHAEGFLERTHGGAIARDHRTRELTPEERRIVRLDEKEAIARRAISTLNPRDIIFLDASSTALQMARFLPDLELTVITNSLEVLETLGDRNDIRLIGTGGHYTEVSRSFIGNVAVDTTRRYNLHKLFFSGNGIDLERGLSESNEDQAQLKSALIPLADRCYFLCDGSKLGRKAAYFFATADDIDCLITTPPEDPAILSSFRSRLRLLEVVEPTASR
jgi:DeoR/GlpR family transcriptional regulator of sugar metabolism